MATENKNKTLMLFLLFISIVMISITSFGGYLLYEKINTLEMGNGNNKHAEVKKDDITPTIKHSELGFIKETEELVFNLSSSKNKRNYLKMKINFELKNNEDEGIFDMYQAIVFDTVLNVASIKTKQELMSIGGKENLKEEIIEELNNKLPGKIIRNVYFRTFVIQ